MDRLSPGATHNGCQVEAAPHRHAALYARNYCSLIVFSAAKWPPAFGVGAPTQAPFETLAPLLVSHSL